MPAGSAKALLLTILGEVVLPGGGEAWTSTLVEALGALEIDPRNARQALARLAEQGLLRSSRDGRRARWALTGEGRRLLSAGAERIYGFGSARQTWDGRWLVVLVSVPEDQRAKRHHLRSQLGFAGFGFVSPGVAICPHIDREELASSILEEVGLAASAIVLRAEPGRLVSEAELLRRAWDLETLASRYEGFLEAFAPLAPPDDRACFVAVVSLVHAWRRFPFEDPEIPPTLLPEDWPGHRAKHLFDERRAAWSPRAAAWFASLEATASET